VTYALEILDVDDAAILDQFVEVAMGHGLDALLARLLHQRTPGGAGHFGYLCQEWAGNTKLAQRQDGVDEHGSPSIVTLIETRGAGGQVVVAPTPPGIHPEHPERGYELVRGSWGDVPIITPEERQALWALARSFNAYLAPTQVHTPRGGSHARANSARPGDTLNATADRDWWQDLLERHGWTRVHQREGVEYWQRPRKGGKNGVPPSARVARTSMSSARTRRLLSLSVATTPSVPMPCWSMAATSKRPRKRLTHPASGRTATDALPQKPRKTRVSQRSLCASGFV
jgi:hypothetical protein